MSFMPSIGLNVEFQMSETAAPGPPPEAALSLTQRIHRVYAELPAQERAVADLALDAPGEVAVWTAAELAQRAGVSAPTVSRLFRRLGYDSAEAARRAARAMRAAGSPLYLAARDGAAAPQADIAAVEMTLSMLNPLTVADVADALARARRVRVLGFRNSAFVADYLRGALAVFRPDVEALTGPGQTLAERLADLAPGDMAVAVGLRRRPAQFAAAMRALSGSGADLALIADRSVRAAPASARWTLLCAVETSDALDTYAGALALARRLALETGRRLGAGGRRRIEAVEALHDALGELE